MSGCSGGVHKEKGKAASRYVVLIADDDEAVAWTLAASFRRRDPAMTIHQARTGREAFSYIRQLKHIDLLVTDINMPQMDGVELLRKIQEIHLDISIVVITGFGSDELYDRVERLGAVRYFTKPFDIDELTDTVFELLEKKTKALDEPGFTGSFGTLKMVDIIQVNCIIQKTGLLRVMSRDRMGKIYFEEGQIIHAETKNCSGEEAVFEIIDWGGGDFEFTDDVTPPGRTISKTWEFILFEHARRHDRKKGA